MGNADLRDISSITEIELDDIENTVVTVDAHNWLYKYLTITVQYTDSEEYTTEHGVELPTVFGAIQGGKRFFEYDITPIFVFDGSYHQLKEEEVSERAEKKKEAKKKQEETDDAIEAAKFESRSTRLTADMIEETKNIFDMLGFQYIEAPQSGESQAAYMAHQNSDIAGIVSDDYDSVLFKSPQTYRNFTQPKNLEKLDFQKTLDEHDITHKQLVNVAILCGTDYNDGIRGYGPKTSVKAVKENSLEDILLDKELDEDRIDMLKKVQNIFLNPDVDDSYSYSTDLPIPDVDSVENRIKELEINLDSLQTSLDSIREEGTQSGISDWG
jgi:flap endonuclease-1